MGNATTWVWRARAPRSLPIRVSNAEQTQGAQHSGYAERGSYRPGCNAFRCWRGELVELAQEGDDERERKERQHQGTEAGDGEASWPAFGLEPQYDCQATDDDDTGGDRA